MCCLFGILDFGNTLSACQRTRILSVLAKAAEARGTDASGIAYNRDSGMRIYKRPLPAHRMSFQLPQDVRIIMGHTRMTTQGDEKRNWNNHPFPGCAGRTMFALAHNGVLYNDKDLRILYHLPHTKVETDSYVAVQMLEQEKTLDFQTLGHMAEKMRGTFNFTVLDDLNNTYFVKGNNPLAIYYWPERKLYLYASTDCILKTALQHLPMRLGQYTEVAIESGEILRIDSYGKRSYSSFSTDNIRTKYYPCYFFPWEEDYWVARSDQSSYVDELKAVAPAFGYTVDDIDLLIADGISPEDIEEYFYSGEC